MKELKIIIIGNRLIGFSDNKNIHTYDQFNYLIHIQLFSKNKDDL